MSTPDPAEESVAPHVVVVGGGIAGLVTARDLAAGGVRVTLLEAFDRLGGKVRPHILDGIELDAGAESFATRGGTVAALIAELGIGYAIATPETGGAWLQPADAAALPLPTAGLLGIPSVPLAADVIAVVGLAGALRAQLDALMLGFVGSTQRSLGALVRRRMGRAVLDRLVTPVAGAIHSAHPDDLDVDIVAPGLRAALLSEGSLARAVLTLRAAAPAGAAVQGLHGGVSRLVEALAESIDGRADIRLGTTVAAIAPGVVTTADGERIEADHIVLAAPLDERPGTPIVLATLVIAGDAAQQLDAAPRGSGVLVAPGAAGVQRRAGEVSAKALTHATAKWGWLRSRATGRHVIRLSYDAAPASDESLREQARSDAAALLGVTIDSAAIVAFDRVEWTGPATSTRAPQPGVTQVGERVSGAGLAAVIRHSRAQAENLLRALGDDSGLRWDET